MNVLILGGAGFIGSHLTNRLLERGDNVVVVDSLETSYQPPVGAEFICGRVQDVDVEPLIAECDVVYHLASSVGVSHIDKNPQQALFNNVEMMNKLVPLFEKHQKKVVFSSSSEVYGEGPFSETDHAHIGPSTTLRWGYALSKLMMEFMITASSFPHLIVRFFNVTGPGQHGNCGMVLPRFIQQAKQNLPLTVYGDGKQIRSFCHIDDAIDALMILEGVNEGIYNIGNETPISMIELATRVVALSGSSSNIELVPYEKVFSKHHGDISRRVPDITKLRSLGYRPIRGLDDIIDDMLCLPS